MNLPLISPLSYSTAIAYSKEKFSTEILLQGSATQTNFEAIYGEDKTPDYVIINANFGYRFNINKSKFITKFGIENILDAYYSTYSDWNNFPRQGRNFFVNIIYSL